MLKKFLRVVGGDQEKKRIQKYADIVAEINDLEARFENLSLGELAGKTREFRIRIAHGETLEALLPEVYAIVREASKKTIGQRHYDVQLIGGVAMHRGIVAEMKTGEGKTLTATLAIYLNALDLNPPWIELARERWGDDPEEWQFDPIDSKSVGRGVHLITVNDYLARRDARWMAPIYNLLGLSIGVLQMASRTEHGKKAFLIDLEKISPHEDQHQLAMVMRAEAYRADITYGTNNEFGFDYLRDNMKMSMDERSQREHFYAIIDEVDNVLIDEARTPLIISGPSHEDSALYTRMARVVKQLKPEDYEINERDRNIFLTEIGETHVEQVLGEALRDPDRPEDITPEQARLLGHLQQGLRAEYIFHRNKAYIVQARKVVIVDEFTGRLMPGRRWSDGLHQAVEAKEGVPIQGENVTYATITIQNYFRMYEKLAGMTGTAVTESEEFNEIYGLDTFAIPSNLDFEAAREDSIYVTLQDRDQYNFKYTYYAYTDDPTQTQSFWKRKDYPDVIYRTEDAKLRAIVQEILAYHVIGRPILVGTTSVDLSERVSERLGGALVRRLAQTLLIRDAWFEKAGQLEDGRQIAALVPLNNQLKGLRTSEMKAVISAEDLEISIELTTDVNLKRLLKILDLTADDQERLASTLRSGIPHNVLNARKHTEESQIIAGAGAFGGVTIATNMAGRGVDIKLGGEMAEEIITAVNRILKRNGHKTPYDLTMETRLAALQALDEDDYGIYGTEAAYYQRHMDEQSRVWILGGLHVIGSERHEARRIDNQLRGRAARQGDPGSSRFYLSLEDDLMIRFGGQQMESMLSRLNVDEALPITNQLVSRIVEQSQTRVEGANFDVRKHLLEYDDVLNTQREKIYDQRDRILTKDDLSEDVIAMLGEDVRTRVPAALEDEDGPWKLLAWLDQIQPSITLQKGIFPSFLLKLLLDELGETLSKAEAQRALLNLAEGAIKAEAEHMLNNVDILLENAKVNLDTQIDDRLELLDMFIEGLTLSEEPGRLHPQKIAQEFTTLLRLPIKLSPEMARALKDDPYEVGGQLRKVVEEAMMAMTITRLIGAVERSLKTSLGLRPDALFGKDWEQLGDQLISAIESIYADRGKHYIGDELNPGSIVKDLELGIDKETLSKPDLLPLMLMMRQGRRRSFDKKSRVRTWQSTTRLTYLYLAANSLASRPDEGTNENVLAHLEGAQQAIHDAWGSSELTRLEKVKLADLDADARASMEQVLGIEVFANVKDRQLQSLDSDLQAQVADELGRQALTKIYRELLLRVISGLWIDYLTQMEALRVAIGLEAYAQRDPLVQYKNKAFEMFIQLLRDMRTSLVTRMFTFQPSDASMVQAATQKEIHTNAPSSAQRPKKSKSRKRRRR